MGLAMTDAELKHKLAVARELAVQAGVMALQRRPPPGAPSATLKGAQDWVTEADLAVEQFLAAELARAFPKDGFQGEETGRARPGACRWVVDPIDGTSNYARGNSRWCVSLGLIEDRAPLLGVLAAPAHGSTATRSRPPAPLTSPARWSSAAGRHGWTTGCISRWSRT